MHIEKTSRVCQLCEDYATKNQSKPIAVICCEGACLRGEIARQAANILCHELAPEQTVRICLGGAFTKDTGQRRLLKSGKRVVALEGCHLECARRTTQGVVPQLRPQVFVSDRLCEFDRTLFGIDQMSHCEISKLGRACR